MLVRRRRFPNELSEDGGQEKEAAADHDREHLVVVQDGAHELVENERGPDLGEDDEKVEDPHVNAGFFRRQRAREDGVGHGQDAGPGDPDQA